MQCHPITGVFGAEVTGIDLNAPSAEFADGLRAALAEHLVIVLRNQPIGVDAHRALVRVFGEPAVNPYAPGPPEHPEMTYIVKEAEERTGVFGGGWHTDLSFLAHPPGGSVLAALEIPPYGGDTMFCSQQAAWASLPEPLKMLLDGRRVAHVGKPYGVKWAPPVEEQAMKGNTRRGDPEADVERWHPAVLTHPVTGRKGLYVNPTYALRIEGMSEEMSAPILQQIFAHCALPEHCLRLRWSADMVVIWDNFSTQHYAINDYHGYRREMRRATFQNDGLAAWA
ncbi:TauD/TfdA family dioxygenase [Thalassococcus sp. S3]|uniref:TauD/TfdA dioxygenase family protein n=1 Tax=Thalassococcus sp. S3 TaxID=2017482 RepID=UPI00102441F0|nr:TauD/TfdA family dioxygenase [Thalassococcus sp. S3]QBF30961.1 taurine dioxygenase [Thalassococcus sp. S3]